MKKGLIYISPPSLTSPSLQNAIDDAPRLDGADLNTPLFSGIATDSPSLDTRSVSTFATSPSLFSAVLKYILHYEFDVSEFLELLDTLDELRIPRMTKEEDVDVLSEFRTFRAHDVTDESLGNPTANNDIVDLIGNDLTVIIKPGDMVEFAITQSRKPLLVKGDIKSALDKAFTVSEPIQFSRGLDIFSTRDPNSDDIVKILPFNPDTLEGEFFSIRQTNALEEYFDVISKDPLLFVGNLKNPFEKIFTETEDRKHTKPDVEDGIAILPPPAEGEPKDGELVDARILPNFVEHIDALSRVLSVTKTPPVVPFEKLLSDSTDRVNLFAKDVFHAVLNENYDSENPNSNEFDYIEYKVSPVDARRQLKVKSTVDKDIAKFKVLSPYLMKGDLASFIEYFSSINEAPDVKPLKGLIEKPLVDAYRNWPSYAGQEPLNRDLKAIYNFKTPKFDKAEVKQIVDFLGREQKLPLQKAAAIAEPGRKKILIDFVIEATYYSIHEQYPGVIAGGPGLVNRIIDLAGEIVDNNPNLSWNRPISGPYNSATGEFDPEWPIGTAFYFKNERYVFITNINANHGKFRPGDDSAVHPAYREKYGLQTLRNLGKNYGKVDRYADSAMVSTNSAKIWSEGAENIGQYMANGFGYEGRYGPAPIKYVYGLVPSEARAGVIDRVPKWHTEQGQDYNRNIYSETLTHSGGRRINLFFREMTPSDITLSNRHNGRVQITRGQTYIDRMLAHSYWGKIFKFIDTIVQVNAGIGTALENIESKDTLHTAGDAQLLKDKVLAQFLHRYETEAQLTGAEDEEVFYDVAIKYFPGPDRDKAKIDALRDWPAEYGPEPANRDSKVKLGFLIERDIDTVISKNFSPLVVGNSRFGFDKIQSETERHPHHIIKKPLYFVTPAGVEVTGAQLANVIKSPTPPLNEDGQIVDGTIWLETTTGKVYLGVAIITGYFDGDPIIESRWDHVGPFEDAFETEEEIRIDQFKVFDIEVAKSKSFSPYIFSGDILSKLDKIFGVVEDPDIIENKGFLDALDMKEEGFYRTIDITFRELDDEDPGWTPEYTRDQDALDRLNAAHPGSLLTNMTFSVSYDRDISQHTYTFQNVFFRSPRNKLGKNVFLNEVAAADSGTAFVPVYCRPSYFMETYVGEDGKYANF